LFEKNDDIENDENTIVSGAEKVDIPIISVKVSIECFDKILNYLEKSSILSSNLLHTMKYVKSQIEKVKDIGKVKDNKIQIEIN
jgi:hypothetical protein